MPAMRKHGTAMNAPPSHPPHCCSEITGGDTAAPGPTQGGHIFTKSLPASMFMHGAGNDDQAEFHFAAEAPLRYRWFFFVAMDDRAELHVYRKRNCLPRACARQGCSGDNTYIPTSSTSASSGRSNRIIFPACRKTNSPSSPSRSSTPALQLYILAREPSMIQRIRDASSWNST